MRRMRCGTMGRVCGKYGLQKRQQHSGKINSKSIVMMIHI
jgi:hypothetical protein